jgi:uncharacterized membrane protein YidH (DUF202 family)
MVILAADAGGLLSFIIKTIGVLIIAMGIILTVLGLVHYAAANSEGDGPAKQKAMMQMAAGVMLIVLSGILATNSTTFANSITTSI